MQEPLVHTLALKWHNRLMPSSESMKSFDVLPVENVNFILCLRVYRELNNVVLFVHFIGNSSSSVMTPDRLTSAIMQRFLLSISVNSTSTQLLNPPYSSWMLSVMLMIKSQEHAATHEEVALTEVKGVIYSKFVSLA